MERFDLNCSEDKLFLPRNGKLRATSSANVATKYWEHCSLELALFQGTLSSRAFAAHSQTVTSSTGHQRWLRLMYHKLAGRARKLACLLGQLEVIQLLVIALQVLFIERLRATDTRFGERAGTCPLADPLK